MNKLRMVHRNEGEQDSDDYTDDIVPCVMRRKVSREVVEENTANVQVHSLLNQNFQLFIACQSSRPFLFNSFNSLGVGLGVRLVGRMSTVTGPPFGPGWLKGVPSELSLSNEALLASYLVFGG